MPPTVQDKQIRINLIKCAPSLLKYSSTFFTNTTNFLQIYGDNLSFYVQREHSSHHTVFSTADDFELFFRNISICSPEGLLNVSLTVLLSPLKDSPGPRQIEDVFFKLGDMNFDSNILARQVWDLNSYQAISRSIVRDIKMCYTMFASMFFSYISISLYTWCTLHYKPFSFIQ